MDMQVSGTLRRGLALTLGALTLCLWSGSALADPPWRRGHAHGHWQHGHGWHEHWRGGWDLRSATILPRQRHHRPPVVVIPGYAVPYSYGRPSGRHDPTGRHGWVYAPFAGDRPFRDRHFRLDPPIR